jgi:hypothetical protein
MLNFYAIVLIGGAAGSAGITLWYSYKTYMTNREIIGYSPPTIDIIPNQPSHSIPTIAGVLDYNPTEFSQETNNSDEIPPRYEDIDLTH